MGAECERLRGERERRTKALAAVQAEVTELKAANVKMAAGLESADHGYYCESTMKRVPENQRQCNCWKSKLGFSSALAQHDAALTAKVRAETLKEAVKKLDRVSGEACDVEYTADFNCGWDAARDWIKELADWEGV
jgi:hypothetical protein